MAECSDWSCQGIVAVIGQLENSSDKHILLCFCFETQKKAAYNLEGCNPYNKTQGG